jgi:hypothetical protein
LKCHYLIYVLRDNTFQEARMRAGKLVDNKSTKVAQNMMMMLEQVEMSDKTYILNF